MTYQDVQEEDRWNVESLRATAFQHFDSEIDLSQLWEDAVGSPPDQVQSRPKEKTMQCLGRFKENELRLIGGLDRLDWHLRPLDNSQSPEETEPPTLGFFSNAMELFQPTVERWLTGNSAITTRLAFGAVLFICVNDMNLSHKELARFLPNIQFDSSYAIDFLYQINRRRQSKVVQEISINRLSKWSVAQSVLLSVNLENNVRFERTQPLCRLELDINTVMEREYRIPDQKTDSLFAELVKLGREIQNRGDIP